MCFSNTHSYILKVPVGVELSPSPQGLEEEYGTLFTPASLLFLHQLVTEFDNEVDQVRTNQWIAMTHNHNITMILLHGGLYWTPYDQGCRVMRFETRLL